MSKLSNRLNRLRRLITGLPCKHCSNAPAVRIISSQTMIPMDWIVCPKCGRKTFVNLLVMGDTDEEAKAAEEAMFGPACL